MHIADVTMFYAPASGGVRSYLQAKHRVFSQLPQLRTSLLVPGAERDSLGDHHTLPALHLSLGQGYRFPLRVLATMRQLGSEYHLLRMGPGMPHHVPSNITIVDRCCGAHEVSKALASSDALLHAGTRETFGLIAQEAMASGIPAIAANAGALAENVPLGAGILCKPLDPVAMAEACVALFSNDVAASQFSFLPGGAGAAEVGVGGLLLPLMERDQAAAAVLVWRLVSYHLYLAAGAPLFVLYSYRLLRRSPTA